MSTHLKAPEEGPELPSLGDSPSSDEGKRGERAGERDEAELEFDFDFLVRGEQDESGLVKHRHRRRPRRLALKVAACVLAALVVACAGAGFVVADSVRGLKSEASSALSQLSAIQSAVAAHDFESAASSARDLQATASQLEESLAAPVWDLAACLPAVGSDVEGARALASVLSDASANALVPLTGALRDNPVESLIQDKTIDVQALTGLLAVVQQAAPAMQRCAEAVDALPQMHFEQLNSAASSAKEKIGEVNGMFQAAAEVAPIAGGLLGAEGDRTYLLVAQNSAELRASGGFPGSVGTLTIKNGEVSFGSFQSVCDVLNEDTPASTSITDEERTLFYGYTRYTWDYGFNPDFERVGSIWAASYEERNGGHVDGVVSLTPSVVQRLLASLGTSVTLSDGTLVDGTNATKVLEHDLYWKYLSNEATVDYNTGAWMTDALFSEAAWRSSEEVHNNLTTDTLVKLLGVLTQSGEDREFMVWMADEEEQGVMESLGVTGALDAATQEKPTLGVFANIWFGSKIGWWFGMETDITGVDAADDGTRTYHVSTTVSNYLTAEEYATGGTYIIGYLADPGYYEPFVYLYAPAGCTVEGVSASNGAQFTAAEYKGLQVLYTADVSGDFDVARPSFPVYPGQSVEVTYDVVVPAGVEGDLQVTSMPTLQQYR